VHFAPATEDEKTLAGVERFLDFLQANNATRRSHVIAVGGGVIQDIATFAAHVYYRGIPWTYLPTTLLGMADSCIGAKCGINLNAYKNQLGVFQSPSRVVICDEFLTTLPDDDLRSGYGEIIKLLLTGFEAQYDEFAGEIDANGFRNPRIAHFIRESLGVKKGIVEQDEYEHDLRRILNYGHTFCHALETITHHGVPHGLAVAWGVDLANYVSMRKGMLAPAAYERIHAFVARHFSARLDAVYDAAMILDGMKRDKKAAAGNVTLILLERPGRLRIVNTPLDSELEGYMTGYLRTQNVFSRD
jgi:3-dehydroquinate synthase